MRISPLFFLIGLSFALIGTLTANNPRRLDARLSQSSTPAQPLSAQLQPASALVAAVTPVMLARASETPMMGNHRCPTPVVAGKAEASSAPLPDSLRIYVGGIMARLRREYGLPGLTLSIVRDDKLLLAQGYGLADVASERPVVAESTLFQIGSVSKTFVWTAVMMLADRGLVDLDANVNRYLKSVRVADAFGTPVTLRQLMHHRAGFEDSMRLFSVSDDDARSLADLLMQLQPKRVYAPGRRTVYSNYGGALAAQVIVDVSGQSYSEFLQNEILVPLGMRSTTLMPPQDMDASTRARLATAYKNARGALDLQGYLQLGANRPAGGIATTATDMARWMRFHLNGGELEGVRLLSATAHARMWTRAYNDHGTAPDLAHGFQDRNYRGLRILGHTGATSAFSTSMVMVPELDLGIFVSQSSRQSWLPVNQLPALIIDYLVGCEYQPSLAVAPVAAGTRSDLGGLYLQNTRVFSGFGAVFARDWTAQVTPVSADALLVRVYGESLQYRRVAAHRDVFESATGERIGFIREGGKVVALIDNSGSFSFEKLGTLADADSLHGALGAALLFSLTILLGFWWRFGRGPAQSQGTAARIAVGTSLLASLCLLAFLTTAAKLQMEISQLGFIGFAENYPRPTMFHSYYAAWAVAVATIGLCLALPLAWTATGWGLWRRLHYTAFTLVLLLATWLLWHWRLFGAPVY